MRSTASRLLSKIALPRDFNFVLRLAAQLYLLFCPLAQMCALHSSWSGARKSVCCDSIDGGGAVAWNRAA